MEKIKVSVIIPAYNCEKYISKCIDSVLNQTYSNYEIIVINDGSKDNTKEILNEYANHFPNKIIHIEQENRGVAKTRDYGISIAQGDYVCFIDNDDFIDEDYLATFVNESDDGEYDVVVGGYRRPNENEKIVKKLSLKNEEWSKIMILTPWAKIYKKQYIQENNISFLSNNIGEDIFFNLQALLITDKMKTIGYIGYNWFFNTKSVSNTLQKDIRKIEVYKLLDETYRIVDEKKILKKYYDIIEMHYIRTIMWTLSYSTKKLPYKVISQEYDKIFEWLEEHFPNYKKTKLIGIGKPKGEVPMVRFMYFAFMLAHRMHLGKMLVFLYSKI